VVGIERHRRPLLAGVVLVAAATRLAGAGARLSHDEGYSWLVASAPDPGAFLERLAAYENTPPLFYALLSVLPDTHEAWLRLPALAAGVAAVTVLYAIVRPLLGTAAALLAALMLAVAPYHVSFSAYSRAFTLAGAGLLLATWAAARLARGGRGRWWWLYAAGAAIALYSEYYSAAYLAVLGGALALLSPAPRWRTLALAALPAAVLAPWAGQMSRALDAVDETKAAPIYPGPGPGSARDVVAALALGEHGSAASGALRSLQAIAVVAALAWAATRLARRNPQALGLIGGLLAGVGLLHALAGAAGMDLFAQRYLTALIPLGAALLAGAVTTLGHRPAVAATAVLVMLGIALTAVRAGRNLEPSLEPVEAAVAREAPDFVVTNSAVVAYYLREGAALLDRPFGLQPPSPLRDGECEETESFYDTRADPGPPTRTRRVPCTVVSVDDIRVAGGARRGPGRPLRYGPFVVRRPAGPR